MTGAVASLEYSRLLTASSGTYVWTGAAATLTVQRIITDVDAVLDTWDVESTIATWDIEFILKTET